MEGIAKGDVTSQEFRQSRNPAVAELLMDGRPAHVTIDNQYPGSCLGKGDGQVGGNGRFPFIGKGAGTRMGIDLRLDYFSSRKDAA